MSPKVLLLAAAFAGTTAIVPVLANQPADGSTPPTATAPAMPGQPPEALRTKILFNLLDRNGDGAIDQDELNAVAKAVLAAVDTNGDGKISADEFAKAMPFAGGHPGGPMGQFMHHGPGMQPGPGFNRFGFDGRHRPRPDWRQGQNDQGAGPGPAGFDDNGPQPPAGGPPDFASLDKNGDGVLTPDEFQNGAPLPQPPAPATQQ